MIQDFKVRLIKNWIKDFKQNLHDIEIVANAEETIAIQELIGDLNICEAVFDSYNNFMS